MLFFAEDLEAAPGRDESGIISKAGEIFFELTFQH